MDVPGYIQDAQRDYIELLKRRDVDEIFIMAPYFSDHKVAKALVIAADRLVAKYPEVKNQGSKGTTNQDNNKEISGDRNDSTKKRIHIPYKA